MYGLNSPLTRNRSILLKRILIRRVRPIVRSRDWTTCPL